MIHLTEVADTISGEYRVGMQGEGSARSGNSVKQGQLMRVVNDCILVCNLAAVMESPV